jgi:hypothetical protein
VATGRARRPQSGSPRLRQLVVRFSEEELREIRGAATATGLSVGAWVGQTAVAAAHIASADAGYAERAIVRVLVEARAVGWATDDAAVAALIDELVDVLVARLS